MEEGSDSLVGREAVSDDPVPTVEDKVHTKPVTLHPNPPPGPLVAPESSNELETQAEPWIGEHELPATEDTAVIYTEVHTGRHPEPEKNLTVALTAPTRHPIAIDLRTSTTDQLRDYALRRKALGVKPKEIAIEVNRNISTVYRWIDDAAKAAGEPQLAR
uniref:Putative bacteriphage excisionase n=1 Tax=Rhodococcus hoagii TaxID=43767 RepID=A0A1Z1UXC8_RHOHA|nr:helix-turn-helix domain-containing protein [Prescottella equi]ARX60104.1 putative bacteriphage excisionase [Prescottella equi]